MAQSRWLYLLSLLLFGLGLCSSNRLLTETRQGKDGKHVMQSSAAQENSQGKWSTQRHPPGVYCSPGICIHGCPKGPSNPIVPPSCGGGGGGGGGDCGCPGNGNGVGGGSCACRGCSCGAGIGRGSGSESGCGSGCGSGCRSGCGAVGRTLYCLPVPTYGSGNGIAGPHSGLTLHIDHGLYNSLANHNQTLGNEGGMLPSGLSLPKRTPALQTGQEHLGGDAIAPASG